jgi:hypothetical protein
METDHWPASAIRQHPQARHHSASFTVTMSIATERATSRAIARQICA